MENRTALLMLCLITGFSEDLCADTEADPDAYVFCTTSPSNLFYAVQSFASIPAEGPQSAKMRFQVFSVANGELKWGCDRSFGTQGEVMLADDGEHVICLRYWLFSSGQTLWKLNGQLKSDASKTQLREEFTRSIERSPVISFYKRDKVIRKVYFHELTIPVEILPMEYVSTSHVRVHSQRFGHFYTSSWEHNPEIEKLIRAQSRSAFDDRPEIEGTAITVDFVDGKSRTFDYTTGEILRTEATKHQRITPSSEDLDPFATEVSPKEKGEQGNASDKNTL